MPKINPFLWFDDNAEEAVEFSTTAVVPAALQLAKVDVARLQEACDQT